MKNLNKSIVDIIMDAKKRGVHEMPIGLMAKMLTDPFGEYRFKKETVKKRLDQMVSDGDLEIFGANLKF